MVVREDLTGIEVLIFYETNFVSTLVLILGAALSTLAKNFLKKIVPAFTAPFVLATWVI